MTTRKAKQMNNEAKAERATIDLPNFEFGIDLKAMGAKVLIGYAYAITAFIASFDVATTLALMTSIVWLQYVIIFAVVAALSIGIAYSAPAVTNAVHDGTLFVARKVKSFFTETKERINSFRYVGADVVVH